MYLSHESSNSVFITETLDGGTTGLRRGSFKSSYMSLSILDFAPQVVSLEIVYLSCDSLLSQWNWKVQYDPGHLRF